MQHLDEVKGKEIVPGLFGRFVHGDKITLSFVDIQQGAQLPEHSLRMNRSPILWKENWKW